MQTNQYQTKTTEVLDAEITQLLADVKRSDARLDTFHKSIQQNSARIEAESAQADATISQLFSELDQIEVDTESELDTLMMQFAEDLETNP